MTQVRKIRSKNIVDIINGFANDQLLLICYRSHEKHTDRVGTLIRTGTASPILGPSPTVKGQSVTDKSAFYFYEGATYVERLGSSGKRFLTHRVAWFAIPEDGRLFINADTDGALLQWRFVWHVKTGQTVNQMPGYKESSVTVEAASYNAARAEARKAIGVSVLPKMTNIMVTKDSDPSHGWYDVLQHTIRDGAGRKCVAGTKGIYRPDGSFMPMA